MTRVVLGVGALVALVGCRPSFDVMRAPAIDTATPISDSGDVLCDDPADLCVTAEREGAVVMLAWAEVYDPDGALVGTSQDGVEFEEFCTTVADSGEYLVVAGEAGTQESQSVTVSMECQVNQDVTVEFP